MSRQSTPLGTLAISAGMTNSGEPEAAPLGAGRLESRRCILSAADSSFLISFVQGRTYGLRHQLMVLQLNLARTVCRDCGSGSSSPQSTRRLRGRHSSMQVPLEIALTHQPPEAANPSQSLETEFEGVSRLGRLALRFPLAAATLLPSPAAPPSRWARGAHRPPQPMPQPASPGIPLTKAPSSLALSAGS